MSDSMRILAKLAETDPQLALIFALFAALGFMMRSHAKTLDQVRSDARQDLQETNAVLREMTQTLALLRARLEGRDD